MTDDARMPSPAAASAASTASVAAASAVSGTANPRTGSVPTITGATRVVVDPSRRADVLFRVRRDEDHEISAWWMIGAFVAVSAAVIVLLSFVPGGA